MKKVGIGMKTLAVIIILVLVVICLFLIFAISQGADYQAKLLDLPATVGKWITGAADAVTGQSAAPSDPKYIAITFDDGPNDKTTPRLLDILQKYNAHATFFVLGQRVEGNGDIIQRMVREGNAVGNHTYDHKDLTGLGASGIAGEINSAGDVISKYAPSPILLRPPGGAMNTAVRAFCKDNGLSLVTWNVDPTDWNIKDAQKVADSVLAVAKPGDIILMHDIYSTSVDAAEIVIKTLTGEGYVFVTVPKLVELSGGTLTPGTVYSNVKLPG